jgi:hypothetical protein
MTLVLHARGNNFGTEKMLILFVSEINCSLKEILLWDCLQEKYTLVLYIREIAHVRGSNSETVCTMKCSTTLLRSPHGTTPGSSCFHGDLRNG